MLAIPSLAALSTAAVAQDEPAAQPFPVVAYERDVTNLAREWTGSYEGGRRSGGGVFQLTARHGTA